MSKSIRSVYCRTLHPFTIHSKAISRHRSPSPKPQGPPSSQKSNKYKPKTSWTCPRSSTIPFLPESFLPPPAPDSHRVPLSEASEHQGLIHLAVRTSDRCRWRAGLGMARPVGVVPLWESQVAHERGSGQCGALWTLVDGLKIEEPLKQLKPLKLSSQRYPSFWNPPACAAAGGVSLERYNRTCSRISRTPKEVESRKRVLNMIFKQ